MTKSKTMTITEALYDYVLAHNPPLDTVQQELVRTTLERFPDAARMQSAQEQGPLLAFLIRLCGARRVVEVGTFTGFSALAMAQALPPDGTLIACDISEEWTAYGREAWAKAGVADRYRPAARPRAGHAAGDPRRAADRLRLPRRGQGQLCRVLGGTGPAAAARGTDRRGQRPVRREGGRSVRGRTGRGDQGVQRARHGGRAGGGGDAHRGRRTDRGTQAVTMRAPVAGGRGLGARPPGRALRTPSDGPRGRLQRSSCVMDHGCRGAPS